MMVMLLFQFCGWKQPLRKRGNGQQVVLDVHVVVHTRIADP